MAEEDNGPISEGILKYEPLHNYTVDVAGDLGSLKRSPTLTNLQNTLTISAHGGPLTGFAPDKSATNELAKTIRTRLDAGKQLTAEDIATALGSATNNVKRAIIDACYAGGYNFQHLKTLFPNLEQIVASSTDAPTSAAYNRYLTRPTPEPSAYNIKGVSPLFSITPTSTNLITQASDWLPKSDVKKVSVPLSSEEKMRDSFLPHYAPVWSSTNYSQKPALPSDVIKERIAAAQEWGRQQYNSGKHLSDKEYEDILTEVKKRISEAFQ